MLIEIIIGFIIACIILYLLYLYLAWCDNNSYNRDVYNYEPKSLTPANKANIEKYGKWILPTYLSDTYKPIRSWIVYQRALHNL